VRTDLSSVFVRDGVYKLSLSYIPENLPHREEHVDEITQLFKPFTEREDQVPWAVMVLGPSGTGKTVAVRRALDRTKRDIVQKRSEALVDYVNCRFATSDYSLAQMISMKIIPGMSTRGYGAGELVTAVQDYLEHRGQRALIALDDFDSFTRITKGKTSLVYDMLKYHEQGKGRVFFILVGIEDFSSSFLEAWIRNYVWRTRLPYLPYGYEQMRQILSGRSEEAFATGAIGAEEIVLASRMATKFGYGSARYGLELLLASGREADWEGSRRVTPESVRVAQTRIEPILRPDALAGWPPEIKRILKKIADVSSAGEMAYFSLSEIGADNEQEVALVRRLEFEGIVDLLVEGGETKVALVSPPLSVIKNYLASKS
jgi:cell division control protein 6